MTTTIKTPTKIVLYKDIIYINLYINFQFFYFQLTSIKIEQSLFQWALSNRSVLKSLIKKEDNRQNDENIESDIFLSQALDVQYQNQ